MHIKITKNNKIMIIDVVQDRIQYYNLIYLIIRMPTTNKKDYQKRIMDIY
jgi:hypothetical protein